MYGLCDRDEHNGDHEESEGHEKNPWRVIGAIVKYFRFSVDDILWKHSFANLVMLMSSIPKLGKDKDKKENQQDDKRLITDPAELMRLMR